jgi:hypothetical protein
VPTGLHAKPSGMVRRPPRVYLPKKLPDSAPEPLEEPNRRTGHCGLRLAPEQASEDKPVAAARTTERLTSSYLILLRMQLSQLCRKVR